MIAAGAVLLGACAGPGAVTGADLLTSSLPRDQVAPGPVADDVVAASRDLALGALATAEPGNAVLSPASAIVALAMLAEGAGGTSAEELAALIGATGQDRTDAVNALLAALEEYDGDPALVQAEEPPEVPLVHVANQVVVADRVEARPEFLDRLATGYGAGLLVTDLSSDEGKAALDAWVAEHTGGLIEESAISPSEKLVVVLQNAVTLAARWASPFDASATRDEAFTLAGGEVVQVPTMVTEADLAHAEVDGWRAVRLPYTEGLHADVVLPPEGVGPRELDAATWADLAARLDASRAERVLVRLPTLDLNTTTDLRPFLATTAPSLLEPATADLSGLLVDAAEAYLSGATQQAVLRVDEAGTVAAAVTELEVSVTSAPPPPVVELRFDRPYLFAVVHTDTSWPLFVADVSDPRG